MRQLLFITGAIIVRMDKKVKSFRDRWKAVEAIERAELRASTPQENWRQLNSIMRRSIRLGLLNEGDKGEMDVIQRWAVIKQNYESRQRA